MLTSVWLGRVFTAAVVRKLAYFAVGVVLAGIGFSPYAMAETCSGGVCIEPAGSNPSPAPANYKYWSIMNYYQSADDACNAGAQGIASSLNHYEANAATGVATAGPGWGQYSCAITLNWSGQQMPQSNGVQIYWGTCPAGENLVMGSNGWTATCSGVTYSCPAGQGWTLSGTNCTRPACAEGEHRQSDGSCSAKAVCFELVITEFGSCLKPTECVEGSVEGEFGNQALCADAKKQGESEECPGGVIIGRADSGKALCLTEKVIDPECQAKGGEIVGQVDGKNICSKADGNPPCADGSASQGTLNGEPVCQMACPAGEVEGTINGATSCWPMGKVTSGKTDLKSDGPPGKDISTKTNGGDAVESAGPKKSTTCVGDRCTTKETYTDGDGNSIEKTTESDKGTFCEENSQSLLCSDLQAGDAAGTAELYTPADGTYAAVFEDFRTAVQVAPFYVATSGFFDVSLPAGSCSGLSVSVSLWMGPPFVIDMDPIFCGSAATLLYPLLGWGLMLGASFVAFRFAFL